MSQNLQNFVKFQKFQLENLVDFEKCCKTHIFLQKSEPIQPKTSNILPKFAKNWRGRAAQVPRGARHAGAPVPRRRRPPRLRAVLRLRGLTCWAPLGAPEAHKVGVTQ